MSVLAPPSQTCHPKHSKMYLTWQNSWGQFKKQLTFHWLSETIRGKGQNMVYNTGSGQQQSWQKYMKTYPGSGGAESPTVQAGVKKNNRENRQGKKNTGKLWHTRHEHEWQHFVTYTCRKWSGRWGEHRVTDMVGSGKKDENKWQKKNNWMNHGTVSMNSMMDKVYSFNEWDWVLSLVTFQYLGA